VHDLNKYSANSRSTWMLREYEMNFTFSPHNMCILCIYNIQYPQFFFAIFATLLRRISAAPHRSAASADGRAAPPPLSAASSRSRFVPPDTEQRRGLFYFHYDATLLVAL
jgi:tRNA(Arg) A34 adenosine deaminase TadA